MISLIICAVVVLCAYAFTRMRERRARNMLAGLHSYVSLPFVGNLYKFFGGPEAIFKKLVEICDLTEKTDNKPFLVWAGSYPILVLTDPEDVKVVTNTFVDKPFLYQFARPWLGDGILTAPGSIWKRNIKKIVTSGSFNKTTVESYQEKFSAQACKLVEQFKQEAGNKPFNMMNNLANITLETVCQTALGSWYTSESSFMEEYYKSFNRTLDLMEERGFNVLLYPDLVYRLTPMYREFKKHVAVLHEVTNTVLAQINKHRERKTSGNNANGYPRANERTTAYKSYLDHLLELQEKDPSFTMEQIMCEVHTIILAGQETVATAIFYVLLMVGCYKEVQNKLYDEVKEVFGDSKRPITSADLDRMPFCEAVVNETLRLYPPAPGVMRYAEHDLPLKSCIIPEGTMCLIAVWGLGHSRRLWGPDVLQFRPERWFEPDCPGNSPAFATFSYGRRACIGKKYAFAFLKTMLAQCVRELELSSSADKMKLKINLALRPVDNYFIQVKLRK